MNRRAFVAGVSGLLIPSSPALAIEMRGTRRALITKPRQIVVVDAISANNSSAASVSLTWPKGAPKNGDYLIAVLTGSSSGNPTFTSPSGWNALDNTGPAAPNNYTSTGLFWKIANGDAASPTWAQTSGSGPINAAMIRLSGARGVAPQWNLAYSTTSPITTTGLTPLAPRGLAVVGINANGGTLTGVTITGSGYTTQTNVAGGNSAVAIGTKPITSMTSYTCTATVTGTFYSMNGYQIIVPVGP